MSFEAIILLQRHRRVTVAAIGVRCSGGGDASHQLVVACSSPSLSRQNDPSLEPKQLYSRQSGQERMAVLRSRTVVGFLMTGLVLLIVLATEIHTCVDHLLDDCDRRRADLRSIGTTDSERPSCVWTAGTASSACPAACDALVLVCSICSVAAVRAVGGESLLTSYWAVSSVAAENKICASGGDGRACRDAVGPYRDISSVIVRYVRSRRRGAHRDACRLRAGSW